MFSFNNPRPPWSALPSHQNRIFKKYKSEMIESSRSLKQLSSFVERMRNDPELAKVSFESEELSFEDSIIVWILVQAEMFLVFDNDNDDDNNNHNNILNDFIFSLTPLPPPPPRYKPRRQSQQANDGDDDDEQQQDEDEEEEELEEEPEPEAEPAPQRPTPADACKFLEEFAQFLAKFDPSKFASASDCEKLLDCYVVALVKRCLQSSRYIGALNVVMTNLDALLRPGFALEFATAMNATYLLEVLENVVTSNDSIRAVSDIILRVLEKIGEKSNAGGDHHQDRSIFEPFVQILTTPRAVESFVQCFVKVAATPVFQQPELCLRSLSKCVLQLNRTYHQLFSSPSNSSTSVSIFAVPSIVEPLLNCLPVSQRCVLFSGFSTGIETAFPEILQGVSLPQSPIHHLFCAPRVVSRIVDDGFAWIAPTVQTVAISTSVENYTRIILCDVLANNILGTPQGLRSHLASASPASIFHKILSSAIAFASVSSTVAGTTTFHGGYIFTVVMQFLSRVLHEKYEDHKNQMSLKERFDVCKLFFVLQDSSDSTSCAFYCLFAAFSRFRGLACVETMNQYMSLIFEIFRNLGTSPLSNINSSSSNRQPLQQSTKNNDDVSILDRFTALRAATTSSSNSNQQQHNRFSRPQQQQQQHFAVASSSASSPFSLGEDLLSEFFIKNETEAWKFVVAAFYSLESPSCYAARQFASFVTFSCRASRSVRRSLSSHRIISALLMYFRGIIEFTLQRHYNDNNTAQNRVIPETESREILTASLAILESFSAMTTFTPDFDRAKSVITDQCLSDVSFCFRQLLEFMSIVRAFREETTSVAATSSSSSAHGKNRHLFSTHNVDDNAAKQKETPVHLAVAWTNYNEQTSISLGWNCIETMSKVLSSLLSFNKNASSNNTNNWRNGRGNWQPFSKTSGYDEMKKYFKNDNNKFLALFQSAGEWKNDLKKTTEVVVDSFYSITVKTLNEY